MAKGTTEGLKNWGGGEKTARPANVGPHDRTDDQHDPANPGTKPEEYEPRPGDNNNRTDAAAPGGPVNIGVKGGAEEAGPGAAEGGGSAGHRTRQPRLFEPAAGVAGGRRETGAGRRIRYTERCGAAAFCSRTPRC